MTMKKTHLLFSTLAAVAAVGAFAITGCSSDDSTGDTGGDSGVINNDSGPGGDGSTTDSGPQNPAPPTLGDQIDRFGRPAINTALNHAFDPNATTKGQAKDGYNQDKGVAGWPAAYTPLFAGTLGVLDSLDTGTGVASCTVELPGCGCGNQFGLSLGHGYAALAGVLADDRLYVNTAGTTCLAYLAVEANATGLEVNTDCGGRRPNDDVIATSYSALVGTTFDDGVTAASSPAGTTFPYLSDPH
jgi:hypothetical protein